ncbi:unnamed protein product, partial [Amoebophrya sp. A120]
CYGPDFGGPQGRPWWRPLWGHSVRESVSPLKRAKRPGVVQSVKKPPRDLTPPASAAISGIIVQKT